MRRRFGCAAPTSPDAIDHLLARGLETIEPPGAWPPQRRELDVLTGLEHRRLRLSDHAPVEATLPACDSVPCRDGADRPLSAQRLESRRNRPCADARPARARRRPRSGRRRAGKVAAARDRLVRSVLAPLNAVLLTRRHIEEVLDDAVRRGRMTRVDAQEMVQTLLSRSARATDDFLVGRRAHAGRARRTTLEAAPASERGPCRSPATTTCPRRRCRSASTASRPRSCASLRDYEQRHANRKTVLDRIDRKLR